MRPRRVDLDAFESVRRDLDPSAEATHFMDISTGPLFRWILNPDSVDLDAELTAWATRTTAWFSP